MASSTSAIGNKTLASFWEGMWARTEQAPAIILLFISLCYLQFRLPMVWYLAFLLSWKCSDWNIHHSNCSVSFLSVALAMAQMKNKQTNKNRKFSASTATHPTHFSNQLARIQLYNLVPKTKFNWWWDCEIKQKKSWKLKIKSYILFLINSTYEQRSLERWGTLPKESISLPLMFEYITFCNFHS